jgi:hypothetical protein
MAQPMTPATKPGLGLCGGEGAKEGLGGTGQIKLLPLGHVNLPTHP